MPAEPPVVIIRHRRERPKKCSLTPLRGMPGFVFHAYPEDEPDVDGHLRLALAGPPLAREDRPRPLLVLDGSWRHAERMHRRYAHVESRSLPRLLTAYPRVSKSFPDPEEGLASIEALIAAFVILGRDIAPLVRVYDRAPEFLAANRAFLDGI